MKALVVILLVAVVLALVLLAIILFRFGLRSYQRYSGLERQRGAAKQARTAGTDRLKNAESHLLDAERELAGRGESDLVQAIERLRVRLSTLADRLRYATYGYSPVASPNPMREAEISQLQERDAETVTDAQMIADLAEQVRSIASSGQAPELQPLRTALDDLQTALDRRRT